MLKYFLLFSLLFIIFGSLFAQDFDWENPKVPYWNTVTTAAPFLQITPDSRGGGMGDLGVASSADNYSQHHNPAKYVFNDNIFGIGIAYSPWLKQLVNDVNLAYLSTFWKVTENDAIAFSLRYFSLGSIQFTDNNAKPIDIMNPHEFALDFTYSRKLSQIVSMAITPRFIYSNLSSGFYDQNTGETHKSGYAGAVDISVFVNKEFNHFNSSIKSSNLMFGTNISNIGNKISYSSNTNMRDFLPCNLRLGLSYAISIDDYNRVALNVEAGKLLVPTPPRSKEEIVDGESKVIYFGNGRNIQEINPIVGIGRSFFDAAGGYKVNPVGCFKEEFREVVWAIGAEYDYRDILFVRVGTFLENKYKGNRKFATVGVGLKYSIFAIDVSYLFSFAQQNPLENTLRFSLTFLLGSFNRDQIMSQGKFNK